MCEDCKVAKYCSDKDHVIECFVKEDNERMAEQIRAEMYAEIKELVEKRETEKCRYGSCDDCECCCEVSALDWLLKQLKELYE